MNALLRYLQDNYLSTTDGLIAHFSETFGVNVKQEDDLYQFKYDMLEVKWLQELTRHCRGHIYRKTADGWKCVSNPWDKFWNLDEGHCILSQANVFEANVSNLSIVEKSDGTAIQIFFDSAKDMWRATTLGMITPGNVGDYPFTFADLFWKTLGKITQQEFYEIADKRATYLFELTCSENRIVTKYPANGVVLLGVRHNDNGNYLDNVNLDEVLLNLLSAGANVRLAWNKSLQSLGITDKESIRLWVETKGVEAIEIDGVEYSEGFVVYWNSVPCGKIKNFRYKSLHAVGGGNLGCTRNIVIDTFFAEQLDDIMGVLHDSMKLFAEQLAVKVSTLLGKIHEVSHHIVGKTFENQKEYALTIQKYVPKEFWGFFFSNKEKLLASTADVEKEFKDWLRVNYPKFEDYWKSP